MRLIAGKEMQLLKKLVVSIFFAYLLKQQTCAPLVTWSVYLGHLAFQRELTQHESVLDPSKSFMSTAGSSLEFLSRQHMFSSRT